VANEHRNCSMLSLRFLVHVVEIVLSLAHENIVDDFDLNIARFVTHGIVFKLEEFLIILWSFDFYLWWNVVWFWLLCCVKKLLGISGQNMENAQLWSLLIACKFYASCVEKGAFCWKLFVTPNEKGVVLLGIAVRTYKVCPLKIRLFTYAW